MLIIGTGGHALEVLDVLLEGSIEGNMFFYDDINISKNSFRGVEILHSESDVQANFPAKFKFILGIGNPHTRRFMHDKFIAIGAEYLSFKSFTSTISEFSCGEYYDVMKGCFIGPETVIEKACLINTGTQIHHEVHIGEFSEISPRATILGKAKIGRNCSIGANAVILPGITIGSNVVIGAGAIVTKNIGDNSLAVGNPAKVVRTL